MTRKKHTIHDAYVKETFSDRERAIVFFESFLPPDLLLAIDIKTLKVTKESYINSELNQHFSDLVFNVEIVKEGIDANLSLLFEHKSQPDNNVSIQVGYYVFSQWMASISQKKKLKPIIPILYYQGKRKWEIPSLKQIFKNFPSVITNLLPDIPNIYIPLNEINDSAITRLRNTMLVLALLTQKIKTNPDKLNNDLSRIFKLFPVDNQNWNFLELTIVYIFNQTNIETKNLLSLIEEIPDKVKQNIMTTYDQIIEQGKEIGKEIGKELGQEIGIQKGETNKAIEVVVNSYKEGIDISLISIITKLSENQVIDILKEKDLIK